MSEWKETKIGVIPSNWKLMTLDEIKSKEKKSIISGPFGSNISSKYFVPKGVPVIRGNNLSLGLGEKFKDDRFVFITEEKANELGTWAVKEDIIFTAVGTIGQVGILLGDEKYRKYIISNKQLRLRVDKSIVSPLFAYYWFASPAMIDTIEQRNTGSSVPLINLSVLKSLNIPIPQKCEQELIVQTLGSLDDKIDLLHRQNKTLEQLAETLFRQWFVEEVVDTWEDKTLGEFIETTLGGEWGKENPEGDYQLQVQCIRGTDIADLETGIPERTPVRFIKQKKFESIEIKDGDLVMEISGGTDDQSTGRTVYINQNVKALFNYPLVFSNFCRLIRPKRKEYSFFLYSYIHHLYKHGDLFNLENGSSGIKNLNYKALLFDLKYKLPVKERVIQYYNDVEQYFYKINKNKYQIVTLTQLRDTLLPKLMSGEVRVKNEQLTI